MVNPAFTEDRYLNRNTELDISNHTVTARVSTRSSRVRAEGELAEEDGVATFEDFGVGDTCVGHVGVDT